MNYAFQTKVSASFSDSMQLTIEALKAEGFGVVSQVDMDKKFKEALGKEFKRYTILGVCMPSYAYQAVAEEELIGLLLPCNLVVVEKEEGVTLVAAVNPMVTMQSVSNPALAPLANDVAEKLQRVIRTLAEKQ